MVKNGNNVYQVSSLFLLTPVFNNQLECEGLNKKLRKCTHVHTCRDTQNIP